MASWRSMLHTDLPAVEILAEEAHPGLPEAMAVYEERLALFPAGCFVLDEDGKAQGYLISHPIRRDEPPALDTLLGQLAEDADTYYIHDMVVSNRVRGRGYAATGISQALSTATRDEYQRSCLISVYGTASFWGRHGFQKQEATNAMTEKLRGYGSDAVYMVRQL
ncbi:acetyltransferase (GNAT) family protein [Sarocladium implicatum]|nr:acetyltransferase (GNAT) family protein [Sarocladium implicatum]